MFVDHYAVLGLAYNASKEEIRIAYRTLAKRWHPDRNPDIDTTQQMQQIVSSYTLLKDDEAKERYNREYERFKKTTFAEDTTNSNNKKYNSKKEPFSQHNYDYEPVDEILKDWMERANQQAKDFVANLTKEAKGIAKDAAVGFGQGLVSTIIVIIIITIIAGIAKGCS